MTITEFSPLINEEGEIDLTPLIENLSIVDKDGRTVKFGDVLLPAQRKVIEKVNYSLNHRIPCRIIVLKARQIGISTVIEAIIFILSMMIRRMTGLVISHDLDSSEHLLGMTQNYYDTFEYKDLYTQKNKSAKHLAWEEPSSSIRISTAKNTTAGRSKTIRAMHGSEVAFWDNAKVLMTGLAQTIPLRAYTFIFQESTANGIGNFFHTEWYRACREETRYIPLFFPWWTHPEYRADFVGIPAITGSLDPEEVKLAALLQNPPKERWNDFEQEPLTTDEVVQRLTWRRFAIAELCQGDVNKFKQEYPSTPEEAFISTGTNVFSLDSLNRNFKAKQGITGGLTVGVGNKIEFKNQRNGPLTLFSLPNPTAHYCIAADPTNSLNGDYAVAQVINRRTWEQVAVYRDKVDGKTLGEQLNTLGKYFNYAIIAPEHLGGGIASIAALQLLNYPNIWLHQKAEKMQGQVDNWYGWQTNHKTKAEAIGNLKYALENNATLFHDQKTFDEMMNFISLGDGKFGNSNEEEHDDCVMSYAIAISVTLYEQDELVMGEDRIPDTVTPKRGRNKPILAEDIPEPEPDLPPQLDEDDTEDARMFWESWEADREELVYE